MANSRDRAELTRVHIAKMQQEAQARCRPEAVQYRHNQLVAQQMPRTRAVACWCCADATKTFDACCCKLLLLFENVTASSRGCVILRHADIYLKVQDNIQPEDKRRAS